MVAIRGEIDQIADGAVPVEQSALRWAPHTADDLIGEWDRPYSRELGAYPLASLRAGKYFPPVSRIDGAYGDRHLVCSCEPLEAYASELTPPRRPVDGAAPWAPGPPSLHVMSEHDEAETSTATPVPRLVGRRRRCAARRAGARPGRRDRR
ncbi:MAG: hypothetical protein R2697_21235 [Ilumatobacteraceae bacterium]